MISTTISNLLSPNTSQWTPQERIVWDLWTTHGAERHDALDLWATHGDPSKHPEQLLRDLVYGPGRQTALRVLKTWPNPTKTALAIALLTTPLPSIRRACTRTLAQWDQRPLFLDLLQYTCPTLRIHALDGLQQCPNTSTHDALQCTHLLTSNIPDERTACARMFGSLKRRAHATQPHLWSALHAETHPRSLQAIVWALRQLKADPTPHLQTLQHLQETCTTPETRQELARWTQTPLKHPPNISTPTLTAHHHAARNLTHPHHTDPIRLLQSLASHDLQSASDLLCETLTNHPNHERTVLFLRATRAVPTEDTARALYTFVQSPHTHIACAALEALEHHPNAHKTPWTPPSTLSTHLLQHPPTTPFASLLLHTLQHSDALSLRICALRVLKSQNTPTFQITLHALSDPSWRVRNEACHSILSGLPSHPSILDTLQDLHTSAHISNTARDAIAFLLFKHHSPDGHNAPTPCAQPSTQHPWWTPDPAVTCLRLPLHDRNTTAQLTSCGPIPATYDPRVNQRIIDTLSLYASPQQLTSTLSTPTDPRASTSVRRRLLDTINPIKRCLLALHILTSPHNPNLPVWVALFALQHSACLDPNQHTALPPLLASTHPEVRRAAWNALLRSPNTPHLTETIRTSTQPNPTCLPTLRARIATDPTASPCPDTLPTHDHLTFLEWTGQPPPRHLQNHTIQHSDPNLRTRLASLLQNNLNTQHHAALTTLQNDPNSRVRTAALTRERAAEVLNDPDKHPWNVLQRAARLCAIPLPPPPKPQPTPSSPTLQTLTQRPLPFTTHHLHRPLGSPDILASPIGLSGHYNPPEWIFRSSLDAGVNLFFWEPQYPSLTRFLRSSEARANAHVITGTFRVHPDDIRADLERALTTLRCSTISVFMLFWVRSQERLSDEALETLRGLQKAGKIRTFGLSTHQRTIAAHAAGTWPVVMTRHNAAHRGAESLVFPTAQQRQSSVVTFSNLCYGNMLRAPFSQSPPPIRPDQCYRYSLHQPGVTATLCAPYDEHEWRENMRALERNPPFLTREEERTIRDFGDHVYRSNKAFAKLVKGRT